LASAAIKRHDGSMSRNLDLALLRAFAAVAQQRNITAASRTLNLTQGAVSQQVARLEALAGGDLLQRHRRGVALTPAGERLLGKAQQLLALNDELWSDLKGGGITGPVRLGVPYDLVGTWMAPILQGFSAAYPQAELSLHCESSPNLRRALADRRLDLAVVEEQADNFEPLRETSECLALQQLVWVGAKGGRAHARTPLPVSIVAETCAFRPAVLAALKSQPRPWRMVVGDSSLEATLATVRMDLAITACLAATIPDGIVALPPDVGLPPLPFFAITLLAAVRPPSLAARELIRHIRAASAQVGKSASASP
jgi:DNA-binding transcriptional LysR family regulator